MSTTTRGIHHLALNTEDMRMTVDFPAPLGPRKPKISPRPTWKET